MRKAHVLIRPLPHYRREAFAEGLRAAGCEVRTGMPSGLDASTVVLMWNRYGDNDVYADRVEAAGGTVLVAENGYIGAGGGTPKHTQGPGNHYYALARHAHNGRGQWHVGGPERWDALGVAVKPWRAEGDHILVCANRSFGMRGAIMAPDWALDVAGRLKRVTRRPIRIRQHPGNFDAKVPLARDLENAHACVIWSSSCGVHALVAGVPVICEAPWWICKTATYGNPAAVDDLVLDKHWQIALGMQRDLALHRLAWAQWTVEEIASGEPFRYLLAQEAVSPANAACV